MSRRNGSRLTILRGRRGRSTSTYVPAPAPEILPQAKKRDIKSRKITSTLSSEFILNSSSDLEDCLPTAPQVPQAVNGNLESQTGNCANALHGRASTGADAPQGQSISGASIGASIGVELVQDSTMGGPGLGDQQDQETTMGGPMLGDDQDQGSTAIGALGLNDWQDECNEIYGIPSDVDQVDEVVTEQTSPLNVEGTFIFKTVLDGMLDEDEIAELGYLSFDDDFDMREVDEPAEPSDAPSNNHQLYRAYNTTVFSTPDLRSTIQIDIMKDFHVNAANQIVVNEKVFVVVGIQRVMFNGVAKLVSSCSGCESRHTFSYYFAEKVIEDHGARLPVFYSCRHVNVVVARFLRMLEPQDLDYEDRALATIAYNLILSNLTQPDTLLVPGDWYCDHLLKYETKKGKLCLFYTENKSSFILVSNVLLSSGRSFLYCYGCRPRFRGCRHAAYISIEKKHEMDVPIPKDEPLKTQSSNPLNLISYLKYPFHLQEDTTLAQEILYRSHYGLDNWLSRYGTAQLPRQEVLCCGVPTKRLDTKTRAYTTCLFSTTSFLIDIKVNDLHCELCNKTQPYEGRSDGIVNFGNNKLVCVELLYEMMNFKYYGGVATKTYWRCKALTNLLGADTFDAFRMKLEKYWFQMSSKLNTIAVNYINLVDFGPNIFRCCQHPSIVCVDGIVLSTKTEQIKKVKLTKPWMADAPPLKTRFSDRRYRSLITFSKEDKEIVAAYIREGTLLLN